MYDLIQHALHTGLIHHVHKLYVTPDGNGYYSAFDALRHIVRNFI